MNTGAAVNAKGQLIKFGFVGAPDLMAVGPRGRLIAIETKRPGGRPTPAQRAVLDAIRAAGGVSLVVTDVTQLAAALDALAADPDSHPEPPI